MQHGHTEGYHIDFAVYRMWTDAWGRTVIERAGTEWRARSPAAVNDWFGERVEALSPKANPALGHYSRVKSGQFRRVVRWVKWYCKSRTGWSLPGGMVVSALLADGVYRPNADQDDRALYDTLVALKNRLSWNTKVANPIDGSDLTAKTEIENQVKRLGENLALHLPRLDALFAPDCTREKARSAWDWIFNHEFWAAKELAKAAVVAADRRLPALRYDLEIRCDLSRKPGEPPFRQYQSGASLLRKGLGLTFTVARTNVPPPYETEWTIQNEGDEAKDARTLVATEVCPVKHTSTMYKGRQKMVCRLKKNGETVAQAEHVVRIAGGWFGRG